MTDTLGLFDGLDIRERPSRATRSARPGPDAQVPRDRLGPISLLDPRRLQAEPPFDPLDALVVRHNAPRRRMSGHEMPGNKTRGTKPSGDRTLAGKTLASKTADRGPIGPAFKSIAVDFRAIVEKEVVPRLCDARRNDLRQPAAGSIFHDAPVLEDEVRALAAMLLANDHARARGRVDALRIEGRSLAWLFEELLTPTADYLRDRWIDDQSDLADITLAFFGLRSLARHMAFFFRTGDHVRDLGRHAVLIAASSGSGVEEIHAGAMVSMMAALLRDAGWTAWIEQARNASVQGGPPEREPAPRAPSQPGDVVILFVARHVSLDEVASHIRVARRRSKGRSAGIVVVGDMFSQNPALSRLVDADMVSADLGTSLMQANRFMLSRIPRGSRR